MGGVAVTDDGQKRLALEKAGHEVVLEHISVDDLLAGAWNPLTPSDVRSATKLTG